MGELQVILHAVGKKGGCMARIVVVATQVGKAGGASEMDGGIGTEVKVNQFGKNGSEDTYVYTVMG